MADKDGAEKNLDQVRKQFATWRVEMGLVGEKIAASAKNEKGFNKVRRVLHHATGYLEESIDQLPKFWFYTWVPKYMLYAYIVYAVGPESFDWIKNLI